MITSFILAAARNQEAVCKAQEEIDRMVGRDRLPDFSDRASLPYLDAFLEELYRCVLSVTENYEKKVALLGERP